MRSNPSDFELKVPRDLRDALSLLAAKPGEWRPFAGGTDLMVLFEAGKLSHRKFVSIHGLRELQGIEADASHVTLGALTTYSQVQAHPMLREEFPMLCRAAGETGAIAIQNRGTVGGNIANASPAADSPPALLAYDCELELVSSAGSRWVAYPAFHSGYKKMDLKPEELIVRARLKRNTKGAHHYYRKVGTRKAQAISKVCFAGLARLDGEKLADVRIALGSVAPVPLRCPKTEAVLKGQKIDAALIARARAELGREVAPIDDIRSTGKYRRTVTQNLLEEFLCGIGSQS